MGPVGEVGRKVYTPICPMLAQEDCFMSLDIRVSAQCQFLLSQAWAEDQYV